MSVEAVKNIKIDPRVAAYKTFFDHAWARKLDELVAGSKLAEPVFSLCMNWKSAANTHLMPWLMIQNLKSFWEGYLRGQESYSEQAVAHLARHVPAAMGDSLSHMKRKKLAEAMRRPLTGSARRPEHIHFRANPRWDELSPHLKELGIEVTFQDELPELEEVYLDFRRQVRRLSPGPVIMLSPRPAPDAEQFPAISKWVQERGRIEVERHQDAGFVARALDDGGLVFEDNKSKTLAEALAALEQGLTAWFKQHGIEVG